MTVLEFFFSLVKSKITKQATLKEGSFQHVNPSLYLGLNGTVLLLTLKPFTDSLRPAQQTQVPWPLPASLPTFISLALNTLAPGDDPSEGPQRALTDERPHGSLFAASPEELPRFPLLPLTNPLSSVFKRFNGKDI